MMLSQIVGGLDRDQFVQSVISLTSGGRHEEGIRALGVPVHSLDMSPGRPSLAAFLRLARVARTLQPDVLVGWMYHGNLAATLARWTLLRRVPVIWNVRQSLYSLSAEKQGTAAAIKLLARLSGSPERIVYNSEISARQHEALGYRRDKSAFIANGCNTTAFAPSEEARLSVRAELGLSETTPLVGRFGRYATMKDYGGFIRAAASVHRKQSDTHFVLAGTGVDGANTELTSQIAALGLTGNFHLLGERSDMARITAALDVACSSSAFGEGFPNVIGEAMSCAVPAVVTDVGDSAWVVGDSGRVVPPSSPESLASALCEVLELPSDERRALGLRARARVMAEFSLSAAADRYEDLFMQHGSQPIRLRKEKPCVA